MLRRWRPRGLALGCTLAVLAGGLPLPGAAAREEVPLPPGQASRPGPEPGTPAADGLPEQGEGRLRVDLAEGARAVLRPPVLEAEGGLVLRYGETVVEAERLHYDDRRQEAVFTGRVVLRQPGRTLRGERLVYHLDTGRARMEQALAEVRAGEDKSPVFLRSPRLDAQPELVVASPAELTTCPVPIDGAPYRVRVRRLEVEPGRWVRAHDAVLWDGGVPLFYWPYLQVSLKNPRAGRFGPPEVGVGPREGWYVRGQLPYLGPGDSYGYVNLGYSQRLGPGVGLYHALVDDGRNLTALFGSVAPNPGGRVPDLEAGSELELQAGGGTVSARLSARQFDDFGTVAREGRLRVATSAPEWGLAGSSEAEVRQRSPGSTGGYAQGGFQWKPRPLGALALEGEGRWDINTFPLGDVPRQLWTLDGRLHWSVPGTGGRLRLTARGAHETHPDLFSDYNALLNRELTGEPLRWVAVERVPELGLRYEALRARAGELPVALVLEAQGARLHEWRPAPGGSPYRPVGVGGLELHRADRLTLEPRLELGPDPWGQAELTGSIGLWHAWYGGGDSAGHRQAALRTSVRGEMEVSPWLTLSAGHSFVQPVPPFGSGSVPEAEQRSPFRFDRAEDAHTVSLGVAAGARRPSGAALEASYDLVRGRWEKVRFAGHAGRDGPFSMTLTAVYEPPAGGVTGVSLAGALRQDPIEVGLSAHYDPRPPVGGVDAVTARLTWKTGDVTGITAAATYNPLRGRLEHAQIALNLWVAPGWRTQAQGSYNFGVDERPRGEVGVVRDEGCREVGLRYDPQSQSTALRYLVKAVPQPVGELAEARQENLAKGWP